MREFLKGRNSNGSFCSRRLLPKLPTVHPGGPKTDPFLSLADGYPLPLAVEVNFDGPITPTGAGIDF